MAMMTGKPFMKLILSFSADRPFISCCSKSRRLSKQGNTSTFSDRFQYGSDAHRLPRCTTLRWPAFCIQHLGDLPIAGQRSPFASHATPPVPAEIDIAGLRRADRLRGLIHEYRMVA